jgi:hypothetical protein
MELGQTATWSPSTGKQTVSMKSGRGLCKLLWGREIDIQVGEAVQLDVLP